jgi:prepilin-type N-terminal cleavage/methylation domain-containing protein
MQLKTGKAYKKRTQKNTLKQGFTLLELMISIVIGGLVVLSLTSVFFSTQQAQKSQTGISDIRDNSFIIQQRLDYLIKHAGYSEFNNQILNVNTALSAPILVNFNNALGNLTTFSASNALTNDALAIQMQTPITPNEMLGCMGDYLNNSTATNLATIEFVIRLNGDDLQCRQNNGGFVDIARNVVRLRFYYKLQDATSKQCVGNWQKSSTINDFSRVCAIYYAMVIQSPANQNTLTRQNTVFDLSPTQNKNAVDAVTLTPVNNGKLMPTGRLIRKVIHLRN